jgi:hypothetical protein
LKAEEKNKLLAGAQKWDKKKAKTNPFDFTLSIQFRKGFVDPRGGSGSPNTDTRARKTMQINQQFLTTGVIHRNCERTCLPIGLC